MEFIKLNWNTEIFFLRRWHASKGQRAQQDSTSELSLQSRVCQNALPPPLPPAELTSSLAVMASGLKGRGRVEGDVAAGGHFRQPC